MAFWQRKHNKEDLSSKISQIKTTLQTVNDNLSSKASIGEIVKSQYGSVSYFKSNKIIDRLKAVTGISNENILKHTNLNTFFENSVDKNDFKLPIVDMCRIERAYYFGDTLLHRRKRIILEKAFNDGYYLESKNESTKKYIEKRLIYNEYVTEKKCWELYNELMSDIIMYDYTLIGLKRSSEYSPGYNYFIGNKEYEPIYAFDRLDVPIVLFACKDGKYINAKSFPDLRLKYIPNRSKSLPFFYNHLSKFSSSTYKLINNDLSSTEKDIPIENIIMASDVKPAGHIYPISSAAMFIEDIQLLRDAEESLREVIFQAGFPLLHFKVGNDIIPMRANEDLSLAAKINEMNKNAVLITDHRTEGKQLITEIYDLTKDLEYLWKRVVVGLDLSDVALGIGSSTNKGTADVTDKITIDVTKRYQLIFANAMNNLFEQMLLEGGLKIYNLNDDNKVYFKFNEIDVNKKILKENHETQMYMQNVISHKEVRKNIGLYEQPDEQEMYANKYGKTNSNTNNAINNAVQPENQYGKKQSAAEPTKN